MNGEGEGGTYLEREKFQSVVKKKTQKEKEGKNVEKEIEEMRNEFMIEIIYYILEAFNAHCRHLVFCVSVYTHSFTNWMILLLVEKKGATSLEFLKPAVSPQ